VGAVVDSLGECVTLLKSFEGCRLSAYVCPAGVLTIGYGETLGVKSGDVWTADQADRALTNRAAGFLLGVLACCPELHAASPERVAACGSLAYNIGGGAFRVSSVRRHTSRGETQAAADAIRLWNKGGGRVLRGLIVRREVERARYLLR